MRHIVRNVQPQALIQWKSERNAAGQPLNFDEFGRVQVNGQELDVKKEVKHQRLKDQGYLCAYTMLPIAMETSHIEHLTPRKTSKDEGRIQETVEYKNMVACFPREESEGGVGFGAPNRKDLPCKATPMDPNCERWLRYHRNGKVSAVNPDWKESVDTTLNLNDKALIDRRSDEMDRHGIGLRSSPPLTIEQARKFKKTVLQPNAKGKLLPFCIALLHAVEDHIIVLEKAALKRKHARRNPSH